VRLNPANLTCPYCGSRNAQMISAIHGAGTAIDTTSTYAAGFARGDRGPGQVDTSGSTATTSQTPLTRRPLPPARRRIAGKIVVLLLLAAWFWVVPAPPNWIEPSRMASLASDNAGDIPRLLLGNSHVFALILVALCPLYLLKRDVSYNRHEYPAHCQSWWKRAYCHSCDTTFQTETQPGN
jgi:hypothetical protein